MLQVGGNSYLLEESLGAEYGSELGVQNLDGYLAIVFFVICEIDSGHPAAAKLTLDAKSSECALNLFEMVSQVGD
jgi:hypothetical protein